MVTNSLAQPGRDASPTYREDQRKRALYRDIGLALRDWRVRRLRAEPEQSFLISPRSEGQLRTIAACVVSQQARYPFAICPIECARPSTSKMVICFPSIPESAAIPTATHARLSSSSKPQNWIET